MPSSSLILMPFVTVPFFRNVTVDTAPQWESESLASQILLRYDFHYETHTRRSLVGLSRPLFFGLFRF